MMVDRIKMDAMRDYCYANYQPAGVSLWLCHLAEAMASDDRGAAYDAILASAPLSAVDLDALLSAYDDPDQLPEHEHIDWSWHQSDAPAWEHAALSLLHARGCELFGHPAVAYIAVTHPAPIA
ncbi:MAG TPA: hypothetical protein VM487_00535 [Phycisphaerae bacterium]|nr:hypothetical protein [Phycisphaerae bacterium]